MLELELKVNGLIFKGWQDISVVRTIRAMTGAFRLQFTDSWEIPRTQNSIKSFPVGGAAGGWAIKPGDECEIVVAGQTLITGYVDVLDTSLSAQTRQISVVGRDKTADLIDCSYDLNQYQFSQIGFDNLVKTLSSKFGIGYKTEKPQTAVIQDRVSANPGETVYSTLEKQARKLGVAFATDGKGNLLIRDTSNAKLLETSLVQGVNIEALTVRYDHTERFSSYKILSQNTADDVHGAMQAYQTLGQATDPRIGRFRPLILNGEGRMNKSQATKRAQWEANIRAARSQQVVVTTPTWFQGDKSGKKTTNLWEVGALIRVEAPSAALDADLLIAEVEFTYTEGSGEQATLTLYPPYAFNPEPSVPEKDEPEDDLEED